MLGIISYMKDELLNEEFIPKLSLIKKVSEELNVSMAQLSIAWCLKNQNGVDGDYDFDQFKMDEQLFDTDSNKQSQEKVLQKNLERVN